MQKSLRKYVQEAKENGVAIGHFNFSSYDVARAIVLAAKELDVPVILGVSEGERDFVGVHEAAAFVGSLRKSLYSKVFLNADHTYSFERVKEAVDAGYDAVIFDGAKLSMSENIALTKKCRDYIDTINASECTHGKSGFFGKLFFSNSNGACSCRRDVLLEAELGYIGQSSKVLDAVPDGVEVTSIADALEYTKGTGIDLFAPAVGNIHGMLKDVPEPKLEIERIGEISQATGLPLVLHGASGNTKEDIQNAIKNGVAIVHVNTEIRVAYRNSLEKHLSENKNEVAPYKFLKKVEDDVKEVVKEKLKFFNFID